MVPSRRSAVSLSLATLLLASLAACANNPIGKNLEQSLAADPQLQDNPVTLGQSGTESNRQNETLAQLPADFPPEIPRYPNATLQEVSQPTNQSEANTSTASEQGQLTRWSSSDPSNLVQGFYQKQFQDNNWEILNQPANEAGGNLIARRNDLTVTVGIQPAQSNVVTTSSNPSNSAQNAGAATEFTIQYFRAGNNTAAQSTPSTDNAANVTPQPTASATSEPTPSATPTADNATNLTGSSSNFTAFSDLNKTPKELSSYVSDVAQLGVLSLNASGDKSNPSATTILFEPNKVVSRREFARWLVAANNQMYANNPAKQIRLATSASQPAFQDVPPTDPDFPAIQGLAEAGIIPSPLSGDSTAVLFRPGTPLTREQMILWKVPLDVRQSLPTATFESVKQTWGFQDTMKIDPKALKAVLADFQNTESSNIRRVFGFTTLFQPKKLMTRAEAAATLWYFGTQSEGISAKEASQLQRQSNQ